MEKENGFYDDELSTEIFQEGVRLIVTALKVEDDTWQLSVQNELRVSTNWLEFFTTAQTALNIGIETIEREGVEEFIDIEGFEYLDEDYV